MKVHEAVLTAGTRFRTYACFAGLFVGFLISTATLRAVDLANLDFTPPELGTYQVTSGSPAVQPAVGPFTNALIFHAVTGGEQIRVPIGTAAPQYEIQFDVLASNLVNSDYAFGVYLDTTTVHTVFFHGGLNSIYVYQSAPFLNFSLAPLADGSVYHFDLALNGASSIWSVAINGQFLFAGPWNGAVLQDIRFGLEPWIGGAANAPNTDMALDNLIVATVPEPTVAGLVGAGVGLGVILQRRRLQIQQQEQANA